MYLDRLLLLYQRLRRDKSFAKPALADADMEQNPAYCQVVLVRLLADDLQNTVLTCSASMLLIYAVEHS